MDSKKHKDTSGVELLDLKTTTEFSVSAASLPAVRPTSARRMGPVLSIRGAFHP